MKLNVIMKIFDKRHYEKVDNLQTIGRSEESTREVGWVRDMVNFLVSRWKECRKVC
jgi:hypothetical protein